jgi:aspartyl-tRNA(Asn)/glutamyl-tRNA(Gln) amidotransferase subunit C
MSVSRQEIERVAALARVGIDATSLDRLTDQISAILDYVAQLEAVDAPADAKPFRPGPGHTPLRADAVDPPPMSLTPEEMAPEFAQGFYVVPKVGELGDG